MSSTPGFLVELLKRQFDSSFERAPEPSRETEDLLFLNVATQKFAIRVREIRGLAKLETLTKVPTRSASVAGLTGVRGELLTVFDLATLLDVPADERKLQWIVVAEAPDCKVGLAFQSVEGYMRVDREKLKREREGAIASTTRFGDGLVGIIEIESIVRKICGEDGERHG